MPKSIFLSAGHSDSDPGAVALSRVDGRVVTLREADYAVEMRNMVAFYLQRAGLDVELDGHGTINMPLREAVKIARKHPIAVEFHCNASDNPNATGAEVLSAVDDVVLAANISRALAEGLGIRNRGAKPENAGQHHRLAFVQAGGLIVEMFFISNPDDRQAWQDRKWLAARHVARELSRAAGSNALL